MEVLIVVAVIILLLGLLLVALNAAKRNAQRANTQALMTSLSHGLTQFKSEVGYLPPVLDTQRRLVEPPLAPGFVGSPADYSDQIQDWFSYTSLAEYLVGWDEGSHDGYGDGPTSVGGYDDEIPPTGIRHPGFDGVWGAGPNGPVSTRSPIDPEEGGAATVYGPYIELDNPRILGSIDGSIDPVTNQLNVFFPGEAGYDPTDPKVIADFWGRPIQYFRRNYPPGALNQSYRAGTVERVPTLSEVYYLRPYRVDPGAARDVPEEFEDFNEDTTTSARLEAAEFALFSSGPDKLYNREVRALKDPTRLTNPNEEDWNGDNIVEAGP